MKYTFLQRDLCYNARSQVKTCMIYILMGCILVFANLQFIICNKIIKYDNLYFDIVTFIVRTNSYTLITGKLVSLNIMCTQ